VGVEQSRTAEESPAMKRLTRFRYQVSNGETVTVHVTPQGVGPRVTATNNGLTLPNTGAPDQPTFEFAVDQVPGNSHFVIVEAGFLDGDPSTARFDLELRGSKGGVFKDVAIRKTNQVWDPEFRFTVT
jgi:hypothetical protein